LRTIVDIRYQSEIELELPWLLATSYLTENVPSGTLYCNVINAYRAPQACSQNVKMLVFIKAADDFELACPIISTSVTPVYALPVSDIIINETIGSQIPESGTSRYAELSVGEQFTSIRQLLSRYTPWLTTANVTAAQQFSPFGCGAVTQAPTTGVINSANFGGDMYSVLGPMYRNFKGSVNVSSYFNSATPVVRDPWTISLYNGSSSVFAQAANNPYAPVNWNLPSTNKIGGNGSVVVDEFQAFAKMPYYGRCLFTGVILDTNNALPSGVDYPLGFLNMYNGSSGIYNFSRAIGEDFIFGYFLSTPLVMSSYS